MQHIIAENKSIINDARLQSLLATSKAETRIEVEQFLQKLCCLTPTLVATRGGHHVAVSSRRTGERLIMITSEHKDWK